MKTVRREKMSGGDDVFDVFDESGDDDDEQVTTIKGHQSLRDPENGVLVFHGGTEKALLVFVKNSFEQLDLTPSDDTLGILIDLIDRFCFERHWVRKRKNCEFPRVIFVM